MKSFFFALIFAIPTTLFSLDWPSASAVLQKNFGLNSEGLPCLGLSFEAEGQVSAAGEGELLFLFREGDSVSRLPSPLGSWAAVDHGDGIISVYGRYDAALDINFESRRELPDLIEKGATLGKAGVSGWTTQNGFYFQLFDRKERRWVNPSLIITPLEDTMRPEIMSVRLKDSQGRFFNPTGNLIQGRYTVIVDARDTARSPNENQLAPHRIACFLNGSEAGALSFETLSSRNGSLMVYRNGLLPVREVYAQFPAYEAADLWLSRGQTSLEISAQDIAGNVRNVVYRLVVE
jgi:hypothetical protein